MLSATMATAGSLLVPVHEVTSDRYGLDARFSEADRLLHIYHTVDNRLSIRASDKINGMSIELNNDSIQLTV